MSSGRPRQQYLRQRIAAAAARMMAEDGIDSYALAKRKAARQLGIEAAQSLPANDEVEEQLRVYQSLYQREEQTERLRFLRRKALALMQALEAFRPYLCGPVLAGTAGRYAELDLQLFTDDAKAVELFLLNRGIAYDIAEERRYAGDQARAVPVLILDSDGIPVNVAIHGANDERGVVRASPAGRPIERAGLSAVRQLVGADD